MLVVTTRESAASPSVTSVSWVSDHLVSVVATSRDGVGSSSRACKADLLAAASFISKKSISSTSAGSGGWIVSFSFVVTIRVWPVSVSSIMPSGITFSTILLALYVGIVCVSLVVDGIMFAGSSLPGAFAGLVMSNVIDVLEAGVRLLFGVIPTCGVVTSRAGAVGR